MKTSSLEAYYVKFVWFTFRNLRRLAYNPQFQELNKKSQAELAKPSCQGLTLGILVGTNKFSCKSAVYIFRGPHWIWKEQTLLYIEQSVQRHNPEDNNLRTQSH